MLYNLAETVSMGRRNSHDPHNTREVHNESAISDASHMTQVKFPLAKLFIDIIRI